MCQYEDITFTNLSTGAGLFEWVLGDTVVVSGPGNFTYSFPEAGVYYVNLMANSCICRDTAVVDSIVVHPTPEAEFSASVLPDTTGVYWICPGDRVEFTVATDPGNLISWSHGGSSNTSYVDSFGTYSVTITNSYGCQITVDSLTVRMFPRVDAEFTHPAKYQFCPGDTLTISIQNETQGLPEWFDGSFGNTTIVKDSGRFKVEFVDTNGCTVRDSVAIALVNCDKLFEEDVYLFPNPFTDFST